MGTIGQTRASETPDENLDPGSLSNRTYHDIFHHLSKKHRKRYVDQFAGKRLLRNMDPKDRVALVTRQMAGRRILHKDLTA